MDVYVGCRVIVQSDRHADRQKTDFMDVFANYISSFRTVLFPVQGQTQSQKYPHNHLDY